MQESVPTPTIDEAAIALEGDTKMQKRKGKASTILTATPSRTQEAGGMGLKKVLGA